MIYSSLVGDFFLIYISNFKKNLDKNRKISFPSVFKGENDQMNLNTIVCFVFVFFRKIQKLFENNFFSPEPIVLFGLSTIDQSIPFSNSAIVIGGNRPQVKLFAISVIFLFKIKMKIWRHDLF